MMRICLKCNEEIADDRRICRRCGSIVPEVESTVATELATEAKVASESNDHCLNEDEPEPSTESISIDLNASPRRLAGSGIWTCPKCNSPVTPEFAVCWNCGTTRDGVEDPSFAALLEGDEGGDSRRGTGKGQFLKANDLDDEATSGPEGPIAQVRFKHFHSTFASWEELLQQAADFATTIGPERLISISHSEDGNDGVVIVWYWVGNGIPQR